MYRKFALFVSFDLLPLDYECDDGRFFRSLPSIAEFRPLIFKRLEDWIPRFILLQNILFERDTTVDTYSRRSSDGLLVQIDENK
jgi:hypothetical protein